MHTVYANQTINNNEENRGSVISKHLIDRRRLMVMCLYASSRFHDFITFIDRKIIIVFL